MAHSDTSSVVEARRLEVIRAMSEEERMLFAFEMSVFTRELAKAAIRRDHPDWPESLVSRELLRRTFSPAPLPAGLP